MNISCIFADRAHWTLQNQHSFLTLGILDKKQDYLPWPKHSEHSSIFFFFMRTYLLLPGWSSCTEIYRTLCNILVKSNAWVVSYALDLLYRHHLSSGLKSTWPSLLKHSDARKAPVTLVEVRLSMLGGAGAPSGSHSCRSPHHIIT